MQESGEPMEFGIFDFYKVFSRAFGEGEDGVGRVRMGGGDVINDFGFENLKHQDDAHGFGISYRIF